MPKKVVKTFNLNHGMNNDSKIYFNTNILNLDADEVVIKNISFYNAPGNKNNTGIYNVKSNIDNTEFNFCPNIAYDSTLNTYLLSLSQTLDLSILLTSPLKNNLTFELTKFNSSGKSAVSAGYLGMTLQFIKFHK
jgi:hypothetical protein